VSIYAIPVANAVYPCYYLEMSSRPITTLFMLMSVDGKISTGSTDDRDFDKDLQNINGVKEGLSQYYDLEQETDLCSLNTGRVMSKVGWNEEKDSIEKLPVDFVVIDSKPHLTELGVNNLLKRTNKLYIVSTNKQHPATNINNPNLELVLYENTIDFTNLFAKLKDKGIEKITVQSGSELNAELVRSGLIDFVSLVVAPLLVGGKETPALVGGKSLVTDKDLHLLKPMTLQSAKTLNNSYLNLLYKIENDKSMMFL
jgi:2,5-diamino-6-(ribosylamino)-4(3H)-pyrimidinone 5'-phosphate reductase